MAAIRVGNAPCSWGVLEFEASAAAAGADQVLDEIAATGYDGTELGDWGFLPTMPGELRAALVGRNLALIGAFVNVQLSRPEAHAAGEAAALRTARLLSSTSTEAPVIVLADEPAAVPLRTERAGRIRPEDGLDVEAWSTVARGVERIAGAVRSATGLRTVFHHHCATWVETPDEVETLLARTDPDLVGLCLDTGHLAYGGGDPVTMIERFGDRVWHVHFKDCEPDLARRARAEAWRYQEALRHGLF
ncbi:MAG: TIM barrel protein, partial [Vicinamibacterales bacterium]